MAGLPCLKKTKTTETLLDLWTSILRCCCLKYVIDFSFCLVAMQIFWDLRHKMMTLTVYMWEFKSFLNCFSLTPRSRQLDPLGQAVLLTLSLPRCASVNLLGQKMGLNQTLIALCSPSIFCFVRGQWGGSIEGKQSLWIMYCFTAGSGRLQPAGGDFQLPRELCFQGMWFYCSEKCWLGQGSGLGLQPQQEQMHNSAVHVLLKTLWCC